MIPWWWKRAHTIALLWSIANMSLAWRASLGRGMAAEFPWFAIAVICLLPLALLIGAERLSPWLRYGWPERFAKDQDVPQGPVLRLLAWLLYGVQTIWFVHLLVTMPTTAR